MVTVTSRQVAELQPLECGENSPHFPIYEHQMSTCKLTSKQDKLCNKCGKTVFVGSAGEEKHSFGLMDAEVAFGYFDSDPAAGTELGFYDGDKFRFSLCAKCLKGLFDTFYIFPEQATPGKPFESFSDYTQEPDETEAKWAHIRAIQGLKEESYEHMSSEDLVEEFFAGRTLNYLDGHNFQEFNEVRHRALFKQIQIRKSAEWSERRNISASLFEAVYSSQFLRGNVKKTAEHQTSTAAYKFRFYVHQDCDYYSIEQCVDNDSHFVPACILKHTDPEAFRLFVEFYKSFQT